MATNIPPNIKFVLPTPQIIGNSIQKQQQLNELSYAHLIFNEEKAQADMERLENEFLSSDVPDPLFLGDKTVEDYLNSDHRKEMYKNLSKKDRMFSEYLRGFYGSIENFFSINDSLLNNKIYDPTIDYISEVVVVTKDTIFKSGFISQSELILETLGGICTIEFLRVDGRADKIVCTLSSDLMSDTQEEVRYSAFAGLPNGRVLVWNLLKGGWSSFYMSNLFRFVRDDTSGLE